MKKRYPLLIVGLILIGVTLYVFYGVFIPFMDTYNNNPSTLTVESIIRIFVGGLIWFFSFGAGLELTLVGLGFYQNQYTGSRMFKGILY